MPVQRDTDAAPNVAQSSLPGSAARRPGSPVFQNRTRGQTPSSPINLEFQAIDDAVPPPSPSTVHTQVARWRSRSPISFRSVPFDPEPLQRPGSLERELPGQPKSKSLLDLSKLGKRLRSESPPVKVHTQFSGRSGSLLTLPGSEGLDQRAPSPVTVRTSFTGYRPRSPRSSPEPAQRQPSEGMTVMDDVDDALPDTQSAKVFYGKYEPKEVLGRGVSSTVRRCIEKETGQEFAVKIIDISEAEHGSDIKESTHREIEVLRLVQGHPYVIELHDVFESETHIFLVFELLRQGELFDYLTTVVTLSEKKTKHIMKQLLEALLYVHDKGVVHRDVKPENILLDDNLDIKLTDFGFARVLRPGEELYDLVGTPGYLAPELLKANMIETAPGYRFEVDTWACGVVMYTLLVGCPPFWHRKQMVMLRNIMEGKYTFGSPEWDDITDAPKDLIRRFLCVDPTRRITVREALSHPFFHRVTSRERPFSGRRMFRLGINCVRAAVRIQRLKYTPEAISVSVAVVDPYRLKAIRKVIDACAFRVYGHWVKKAEGQNRAMLFENSPKTDLLRTVAALPVIVAAS